MAKLYFSGGTLIAVRNSKGVLLGRIYYEEKWRTLVWDQERSIIMSYKCLEQVMAYIKDLSERRGIELK